MARGMIAIDDEMARVILVHLSESNGENSAGVGLHPDAYLRACQRLADELFKVYPGIAADYVGRLNYSGIICD